MIASENGNNIYIYNFVVITVPGDGLAPFGGSTSDGQTLQ